MTIQILAVHQRGDFFWINSDSFEAKKHFGDTPRALNRFELTTVIDKQLNKFKLTKNIQKLLFDYKSSRFLECNQNLAHRQLIVDNTTYEQNDKKNTAIATILGYVTGRLVSVYKHYWLAGGTLLGWYRDCGIISHTKDVDLAIWSHEYDDKINRMFIGNSVVNTWLALGTVR